MVGILSAGVPLPRRPLTPGHDEVGLWYENVLGWPTVPGVPVRLAVGVRFDVLDVPAEAGYAALEHWERPGCSGRGFPVSLSGDRMWLLVAEGSAAELPGLLEWLEWGAPLELDLRAIGAGGLLEAPRPAGSGAGGPGGRGGAGSAVADGTRPRGTGARNSPQGAAVWLRPPEPGAEAGASLPTLSAMGTRGVRGDCAGPPDLVRLVNTLATHIHRVRLRRACAAAAVRTEGQPLAFS
ncbi:SCO3374 family protein [Streptomyces sp. NPDC006967]|uniref:SCO3374 family protein n=1 Tax=unclassified Streptomyces TaxID=2593676 RepID=UPI000CD5886F|nr:SCO3374 family protein [Streptomyces sp. SM1]